jgi:hypothetical protein
MELLLTHEFEIILVVVVDIAMKELHTRVVTCGWTT